VSIAVAEPAANGRSSTGEEPPGVMIISQRLPPINDSEESVMSESKPKVIDKDHKGLKLTGRFLILEGVVVALLIIGAVLYNVFAE